MSPRPAPSASIPLPAFRIAGVPRLVLAACLTLLFASGPGEAQYAPFPLERGEAVATCFSGYAGNTVANGIDLEAFVVAVVDVRNPPGALVGQHWPAPMYHNEHMPSPTGNPAYEWKAKALGQVFGIALGAEPSPSIFVTATSAYLPQVEPDGTFSQGNFGPLGPGGVYRLDGASGAICEHAQLDNSGPALGNVAFDRQHQQLFVSNLEDGTIVRLRSPTLRGRPSATGSISRT